MGLEQGDLLHNRYRIREILGRGGMGAVFRAIDESLGLEVAVKENLFITEDYERQFRLEAVILASLRHPNLPRVTDHFVIDDQGQYLVMDYIEGKDLRQIMEKNGALTEDETVRIGVTVCDALTYLHSRKPPVLHRDIKPGNIRIAPDGHVYLVDFGLAKMAEVNESTLTGARAMSPGYSPPEQYGTSRTDSRTDIYSLGATLYAALAAYVPEDSLARAMEEVKLTPLRKRNSKVSARVAAAIEKAMETSQANRFQSAEDFKRALLGVQVAQPDPAKSPTVPPPPLPPVETPLDEKPQPRPRRKSSALPWIMLITILFILGAAARFMMQNPASAPEALRPWFPLTATLTATFTATSTATNTPTSTTIPPTFTFTPLPLPTLTLTVAPKSTKTHTLAPPATLEAETPRTETSAPASETPTLPTETPTSTETPSPTVTQTFTPSPTLTGGGTGEIAFVSQQGNTAQIFLARTDGSNITQLTTEFSGACQPSWSPDGTKLVFVSPCYEKADLYPKSGLYILNLETSGIEPLPADPAGDFEPAWSPDGNTIAFTSLRDAGLPQVFAINLTDSTVSQLTKSAGSIQARQPAWSPDGKQIVYTVRRNGLLQIWTMAADGSNQNQLVRTGGSFSDHLPAWSPDGKYILFSEGKKDATTLASLLKFSLDTMQSEIIIPNTLATTVDVDFSSDGIWIVYESSDAKNQSIRIYNLQDGTTAPLPTFNTLDYDPAWRPIGQNP